VIVLLNQVNEADLVSAQHGRIVRSRAAEQSPGALVLPGTKKAPAR